MLLQSIIVEIVHHVNVLVQVFIVYTNAYSLHHWHYGKSAVYTLNAKCTIHISENLLEVQSISVLY